MTDRDIPYFKIKYAFKPLWSLKEAAHLLQGLNPENSKYQITPDATNKVSLLCYWLVQKRQQGKFNITQIAWREKDMRYEAGQLFECMKAEGKRYDKDIDAIRKILFSAKNNSQIKGRVNRTLYRHAAAILWKNHPNLRIADMAKILMHLPDYLADKYPIDFLKLHATSIEEHLKGMSPHGNGAASKSENRQADIDWDELLEKM